MGYGINFFLGLFQSDLKCRFLMCLATLFCLASVNAQSSGPPASMGVGYLYDAHVGSNWFDGQGFQLSLGVDEVQFKHAPLAYSFHSNLGLSWSGDKMRLDDVLFETADSLPDALGSAETSFSKFVYSLDFDLSYSDIEYDVVAPYVTLGWRMESYWSNVDYELYEPDSCLCETTREPLTNTFSMGFNTGVGVKIRLGEGFLFDLRAQYYGGWAFQNDNSTRLPISNTFMINDFGNPAFQHTNQTYNDGFQFSVSFKFPFRINTDDIDWKSSSNEDNDQNGNDYDYNQRETESTPSGSTPEECEPLTPSSSGSSKPKREKKKKSGGL